MIAIEIVTIKMNYALIFYFEANFANLLKVRLEKLLNNKTPFC